MRKLASTRRAHGEPDQAQIRRTYQTVLQGLDKQNQEDADTDSFLGKQAHWKARDAKKGASKHGKHESLLEILAERRSVPNGTSRRACLDC